MNETHAIVLVRDDSEEVVELTSAPEEALTRWSLRAYGTPKMAGEWDDEPLVACFRLAEHAERLGIGTSDA